MARCLRPGTQYESLNAARSLTCPTVQSIDCPDRHRRHHRRHRCPKSPLQSCCRPCSPNARPLHQDLKHGVIRRQPNHCGMIRCRTNHRKTAASILISTIPFIFCVKKDVTFTDILGLITITWDSGHQYVSGGRDIVHCLLRWFIIVNKTLWFVVLNT